MADLISRAGAIEYLMTNMGWHDEDGYEVDDADEKRAIITDLVNGIPAVDAIPVEWLLGKREHCKSTWDINFYEAVQIILGEWQKEQEGERWLT